MIITVSQYKKSDRWFASVKLDHDSETFCLTASNLPDRVTAKGWAVLLEELMLEVLDD